MAKRKKLAGAAARAKATGRATAARVRAAFERGKAAGVAAIRSARRKSGNRNNRVRGYLSGAGAGAAIGAGAAVQLFGGRKLSEQIAAIPVVGPIYARLAGMLGAYALPALFVAAGMLARRRRSLGRTLVRIGVGMAGVEAADQVSGGMLSSSVAGLLGGTATSQMYVAAPSWSPKASSPKKITIPMNKQSDGSYSAPSWSASLV